jgi:hypothetical protein
MDGYYYVKIAQNFLGEINKNIEQDNLDAVSANIREVMSAMNYLWDWVDAKQDKPR